MFINIYIIHGLLKRLHGGTSDVDSKVEQIGVRSKNWIKIYLGGRTNYQSSNGAG